MSELKPCPFCGGAAKLSVYYDFYRVHCNNDDCIAGLSASDVCEGHGQWYKNISEARAAWNTRAERTCKFIDSNGTDYPPVCSACGYDLGIYDCAWYEDGTYGYERNYCPNCGAKVVEE